MPDVDAMTSGGGGPGGRRAKAPPVIDEGSVPANDMGKKLNASKRLFLHSHVGSLCLELGSVRCKDNMETPYRSKSRENKP